MEGRDPFLAYTLDEGWVGSSRVERCSSLFRYTLDEGWVSESGRPTNKFDTIGSTSPNVFTLLTRGGGVGRRQTETRHTPVTLLIGGASLVVPLRANTVV